MCQEPTESQLIGCLTGSIWISEITSNMLTPRTNLQTYESKEVSHAMSGIKDLFHWSRAICRVISPRETWVTPKAWRMWRLDQAVFAHAFGNKCRTRVHTQLEHSQELKPELTQEENSWKQERRSEGERSWKQERKSESSHSTCYWKQEQSAGTYKSEQ